MQPIAQVLDVRPAGGDRFTGPVVASTIERTFGGQVLAQTLRAAQATVAPDFLAHSLHAYFLAPSDATAGLDLEVERLRDGRSFAHRQARASQSGTQTCLLTASFQRAGSAQGPEHSATMPHVPAPEGLERGSLLPATRRILLGDWDEWDIRMVPESGRDFHQAAPAGPGFRNIWFRNTGADLPADAAFHQATLAYMSDMTLLRTSLIRHPDAAVHLASLDHSLWFLREFRVDEWLLYSQDSPSAQDGRGLSRGIIFNQSGQAVAAVTQEGLTRTLRDPATQGWA